jgi:hypothetical protein
MNAALQELMTKSETDTKPFAWAVHSSEQSGPRGAFR